MSRLSQSMMKKGYVPLADDGKGAIGWQGEYLKDFWMWTRKFDEYKGGVKHIKTVQVKTVKEAAEHYFKDKWLPIKPIEESFLRKMEKTLREHVGFKKEGQRFPGTDFLAMPEKIPTKYLPNSVRLILGLRMSNKKLIPIQKIEAKVLKQFKEARI